MDDLFVLAADGVHAEVLDGRLLLAPPRLRRHERVVANLGGRFRLVVPGSTTVRSHEPVRLPGGDGPVPDLLVATAADWPGGWPAAQVYTVAEVVAGDGQYVDRVWKRDRYGSAGIPCYWRVELTGSRSVRSPLPMVVVRVRERSGWREIIAAAGRVQALPVAYGRDATGAAMTVSVRIDPMTLLSRPATEW